MLQQPTTLRPSPLQPATLHRPPGAFPSFARSASPWPRAASLADERAAGEPAASIASPSAVRRVGERGVEACDGATLPQRCVCCGDTVELRSLRTVLGNVRYSICRDDLVSACARLLVGALMLALAGWSVAEPVLDGGWPRGSMLVPFGAVGVAGAGLAWFALPLRVGRRGAGGWRRVSGACAEALRELDRT